MDLITIFERLPLSIDTFWNPYKHIAKYCVLFSKGSVDTSSLHAAITASAVSKKFHHSFSFAFQNNTKSQRVESG